MKKQIKHDPETGEVIEEEEAELEEGQKKSFDDYILDETICPSSTIVFDQSDEFLTKRVLNLDETKVAKTHYTAADMGRR